MVTLLPQPDQLTRGQPEEPSDDTLGDRLYAHRQAAYNLAYRLLRRQEDAADAVQDAYLLAMQAMSRDTAAPREPGSFAPWLLKIVANVALGKLRRRSGSLASIDDLPQEPPDNRVEQPLPAIERRERRRDVLYALLTLPDAQRAALTLREYQGLDYDEIGDLLGLNRAAIGTLLYRARTSFREAYEGLVGRSESLSCPDLAPMVSAMLDHELEPDSWAFVRRHLDRCRRCQWDLRQLRRSRRLYRAVPLLLPPAGWSWASTLEAASTVGAAGAASLAASTGGIAPTGVAPAVAGSTAALTGASVSGPLASIGGMLAGKVASTALALGLGLAAVVAPISDNQPLPRGPVPEAVHATETMPAARSIPSGPTAIDLPTIDASSVTTVNSPALGEAASQPLSNAGAVNSEGVASGPTVSVQRAPLVPADAADRVSTAASATGQGHVNSSSSGSPSPREREAHDADHDVPSGDRLSTPPAPSALPVAAVREPDPDRGPSPPAYQAAVPLASPPHPSPPLSPPAVQRPATPPPTGDMPEVDVPSTELTPVALPIEDVAEANPPSIGLQAGGPLGVPPPTDDVVTKEPPEASVPTVQAPALGLPAIPHTVGEPPKLDLPPVDPPTVDPPSSDASTENVPTIEAPQAQPSTIPAPVAEPPELEVPDVAPSKTEPPKGRTPRVDPPAIDPPTVDPPKVDPAKARGPKAEPPKVDPPKAQVPKVDPPKTEPAKAEPPQVQTPKVDPPKTEPPKATPPKTEPPKATPPKTEPPKATPPKAEPPKAQTPKVEPPKVDLPKATPPKVDPPKVDPPKVDPPKAQTSKVEPPKVGR